MLSVRWVCCNTFSSPPRSCWGAFCNKTQSLLTLETHKHTGTKRPLQHERLFFYYFFLFFLMISPSLYPHFDTINHINHLVLPFMISNTISFSINILHIKFFECISEVYVFLFLFFLMILVRLANVKICHRYAKKPRDTTKGTPCTKVYNAPHITKKKKNNKKWQDAR